MTVSRINASISAPDGSLLPAQTTVFVLCQMDPGEDYPNPITTTPFPVTGLMESDGRIGIYLPDNIKTGVGLNLHIIAPGCADWYGRALTPNTAPGQLELTEPETGVVYGIALQAGTNPFRQRPSPRPRGPLTAVMPVCGSCPSPTSYDKDLATIWPSGVPQSRDYLRAASWNIPIPGLPFVPGGSSEHPERFLSYFFDLYPQEFQQTWLTENALNGNTHIVLSWPDSRARAGRTLSQFVATCQRVRAMGFYVHCMLWSKDFDPHDMTLPQWVNFATPLFAALNGVVDEYSVWEYDSGNLDGQTAIDVHNWLADEAHSQGASFWCHFLPGHGFWDARGFVYWWQAVKADGLDYQADPAWDIGVYQSRLVDVINRMPPGKKVRSFEPGMPSLEFSHDHPTQDEAEAFGYSAICTRAAQAVWGFGDGARWPSGTVI